MKIERRKFINNEIMAELHKKHPVKSEKGICYAQDMDYITLEVEAFNNATFRKLVKANNQVLVVYMYLRERMCHNGWYVLWDNDTKEDIMERLTLWGVSENDSSTIINSLLDNKIVHSFQHDGLDYITDVQQIYNWEMLQAKRARDRNSKNKQSKASTNTTPINDTTTDYMSQDNNLDYTDNGFNNVFNDNFDNNYDVYDDGLPFN